MADALFSASFLNACLRHASDVGMANIAPIVNTRGPLYVHKSGLVKRTTFHVLSLYANKLESRVAASSLTSPSLQSGERSVPTIDGIATVNPAGSRWTVVLINRDPDKTLSVQLNIQGANLDGVTQAIVLDGDSPEAYNDEAHPNRVVPRTVKLTLKHGNVELPPHSLSLVFLSSKTTNHN
jgi:alpha-N-arabinofuranosidase